MIESILVWFERLTKHDLHHSFVAIMTRSVMIDHAVAAVFRIAQPVGRGHAAVMT